MDGTTESYTKTIIRTLSEIFEDEDENQQAGPYSMDELTLKYASARKRGKPARAILSSTAIISIFSSLVLVWMIRRSHVGLSSTNTRLLIGLCIADLMSSSSYSVLAIWVPSELNYYTWSAIGNATTCTIQGCFCIFGTYSATLYNCSLNLYYLAVVKYEKSDEYISKKIEPFMHGTAIIAPLIIVVTFFFNDNYNDNRGPACISPVYNPPHCVGYEDGEIRDGFTIPCGRGRGLLFFTLVFILITLCLPLFIGGSLLMIYRSVRKLEKKLSRYGRGSLKASVVSAQTLNHRMNVDEASEKKHIFSHVKKVVNPIGRGLSTSNSQPSNTAQSRAVMHKAIAYTISYFLTWTPVAILVFQGFIAKKDMSLATRYLGAIFVPLQGLYNLIIFMFPKVLAIKNKSKKNKVTWRQAIVKAFWSRGGEKYSRGKCNNGGRLHNARTKRFRKNNLKKGKDIIQKDGIHLKKERDGIHDGRIENEGEEEKTEMIMPHLTPRDDHAHNINSTVYEQNLVTNSDGSEVKKNALTKALSDGDIEDGT